MKTTILKRIFIINRLSDIVGLISCILLCAIVLMNVTKGIQKVTSFDVIATFLFFTLGIFFFIARLRSKNKIENFNNVVWKYELFRKYKKWIYIGLSGLRSSMLLLLVVFCLAQYNNWLTFPEGFLAYGLVVILATVRAGYLNYYNCLIYSEWEESNP